MNALELADWIKDTEFYDNPNPEINDKMDEVEDMLRKLDGQLAFRIDAVTKYQAWVKELEISKQSWEIIAKGYGKTIDEQQAEIEKLRGWVEMLVEVPFFNEIDHYRGIPVAILRKAQEK